MTLGYGSQKMFQPCTIMRLTQCKSSIKSILLAKNSSLWFIDPESTNILHTFYDTIISQLSCLLLFLSLYLFTKVTLALFAMPKSLNFALSSFNFSLLNESQLVFQTYLQLTDFFLPVFRNNVRETQRCRARFRCPTVASLWSTITRSTSPSALCTFTVRAVPWSNAIWNQLIHILNKWAYL